MYRISSKDLKNYQLYSVGSQPHGGALRLFERCTLLFLDLFSIILSFLIAWYIRWRKVEINDFASWYFCVVLLVVFGVFLVFDLYKIDSRVSRIKVYERSIIAGALSFFTITSLSYLNGHDNYIDIFMGRGVLLISMLSFVSFVIVGRYVISKWIFVGIKKNSWLFVGMPEELNELLAGFMSEDEQDGIQALIPPSTNKNYRNNKWVLGSWDRLAKYIDRPWSGIIVGDRALLTEKILKVLMVARLRGRRVYDIADFYENVWSKLPLFFLKDRWFVLSHGFLLQHSPFQMRLKGIMDKLLAALLFVVTFPILVLAAIFVKVSSRGPIIYKQVRTGFLGEDFIMYKFRTMFLDAERDGARWASKDDCRITSLGKALRKTRIDELPQIINIMKGEMSFIGPRPERPEFNSMLQERIPYYNLRHLIKPGVTGWAQVLYPYGASIKDATEKLQYDFYYIKNYSLLLDISIIIKTIRVVIFGRGI